MCAQSANLPSIKLKGLDSHARGVAMCGNMHRPSGEMLSDKRMKKAHILGLLGIGEVRL